MDSLLQFAIFTMAVLLGLAIVPWVIYVVLRVGSATVTATTDTIFGSYADVGQRFANWRTQRSVQEQFRAFASKRTHQNRWSSGKGGDVYAAAAVLKQTVSACNMVHHYAANALVVEDYSELEDNVVCAVYRTKVVQITDAILDDVMARDISRDPTAAKMLIGLDRMRDMCADCVLLKYSRTDAPPLCDPAVHMGCTEADERKL